MYIHKQILSQELIFGISYLFIYLFVCFVQFQEFYIFRTMYDGNYISFISTCNFNILCYFMSFPIVWYDRLF